MPAISIIIPVYNVEKYLRRCLDSVLNQTFTDWQAICVNDGSPDNSGEILSEYASRDSRFIIVNKENGGLSDARNAGMPYATGEYIMYLDSDDFIHPQTMEIAYFMARRKNADMVAFGYDVRFHRAMRRRIARGENIDGILPASRTKRYNPRMIFHRTTDRIYKYATERNKNIGLFRVRHCFPPMRMYRRNLISDIGFIRGIIMEDFPWWSAVMLRRPRTVIINTPLYFYMPNPASILNSSRALRMIASIGTGLNYAYELYRRDATRDQQKYYSREFLWPFIIIAMRQTGALRDASDVRAARNAFRNLRAAGVLDNPVDRRARRYVRKINDFIK